MSGGIDSAVSASILKANGYQVIGVTLALTRPHPTLRGKRIALNYTDVHWARLAANALGIPHYSYEFPQRFDQLVTSYLLLRNNGVAPAVCVHCNPFFKFHALNQLRKVFDCQYIATGHYARIARTHPHPYLQRAHYLPKDQSFFLARLSGRILENLLFPLGTVSKPQVKQIASTPALRQLTSKPESMGVCFLKYACYSSLCASYRLSFSPAYEVNPPTAGCAFDVEFDNPPTIGQKVVDREGHAHYIQAIDAKSHRLFVTQKKNLRKRQLIIRSFVGQKYRLREMNARSFDLMISPLHPLRSVKTLLVGRFLYVESDAPFEAPAPGQPVVFLEGSDLAGSGIITGAL